MVITETFSILIFLPVVCQVEPRRRGDNKNQLSDIHRHSSTGHQHERLQEGMQQLQQPEVVNVDECVVHMKDYFNFGSTQVVGKKGESH